MLPSVASIVEHLDAFAPPALAAEWDNVGLLLGDRATEVRRILTCLTVTPEVVREAAEWGAQLIVTHHPILFRGAKRLTTDTSDGAMVLELARAGIAVYSPHTAFDNTAGGINDMLAGRLGLTQMQPLRRQAIAQFKIVVFVPDADLARVSDALFAAGAGIIGQYSQCSFRLAGAGTFFGSDAANPTVGQKGRREEVSELRLEVICPAAQVEAAIAAMRKAHSYEEPAFDVYPLRPCASSQGEGRIGRLPAPASLEALGRRVKEVLAASAVQLVGNLRRIVERIAIVCGAGSEFLSDAIGAKADVFLTGEMRFHDYLAAQAQGIALCLPGHYATERFAVEELAERLRGQWSEVEAIASRLERDPGQWVC